MKKQFGIAMIALSAAMAFTFTACNDDSSSAKGPEKVSKVEDLSAECEDGDEALVGDDEVLYTCTDGKWATEAKSSASKPKSSSSKVEEEDECDPDLENCDDDNGNEENSSSSKKPSGGKGDSDSGSGSGSGGSGSGGSGSGSEEGGETPSTSFKVNISATTVEYGETVDFTAEGASNCHIYVYAADDVGGASESDFEVSGESVTKVPPSDYYDSPTCALTVKNVSTKTEDKDIVVRVDSYEKGGEEIFPETEDASVKVTLKFTTMCNGTTYNPEKEFCMNNTKIYELCDGKTFVLPISSKLTYQKCENGLVYYADGPATGREYYFIDLRDNSTYSYITKYSTKIMTQNLRYVNESVGQFASASETESDKAKYGAFYTFAEAKSVCPSGWHLMKQTDYEVLFQGNGSETEDFDFDMGISFSDKAEPVSNLAYKFKSTTDWTGTPAGTNSSRFNVYPAGDFSLGGSTLTHRGRGLEAFIWMDKEFSPGQNAYAFRLLNSNDQIKFVYMSETLNKYSVRCAK